LELPVAVQRRCIELQLAAQGLEPDYELVEQLRKRPGRAVSVRQSRLAGIDAEGLVRLSQAEPAVFRPATLRQDLSERAGEALFDGLRLGWLITRGGSKPRPGRAQREFFDAERVGTPVVLRHWQPGDRFQPIGMPVPVKLQDLFTNQKVSRRQRHELIVAATARGDLFWVEGLRISERFKLRQTTKRRLQWTWERL